MGFAGGKGEVSGEAVEMFDFFFFIFFFFFFFFHCVSFFSSPPCFNDSERSDNYLIYCLLSVLLRLPFAPLQTAVEQLKCGNQQVRWTVLRGFVSTLVTTSSGPIRDFRQTRTHTAILRHTFLHFVMAVFTD